VIPTLNLFENSAAAYGRASTDKQDQSIAAQGEKLTSYAVANSLILDDDSLFLEDDVSGGIPFAERPGGRALLVQFEAGRYRHLIVPTIDRLGRNALDVQNTIERIHQLGGTVHILDLGGSNFNTRSPVSGLIIAVLAWAAQMELARIRERVQGGLDRKRANGELCGTESYGWDAVPTGETRINKGGKTVIVKRIEPNFEEQKWILHMQTCRQTGLSWQAIARDLNQRGVKTKLAGRRLNLREGDRGARNKVASGLWQGAQVKKILESKTVRAWLASREQN
jgi:putative DNA-invertase from lambdoid prophage Rac